MEDVVPRRVIKKKLFLSPPQADDKISVIELSDDDVVHHDEEESSNNIRRSKRRSKPNSRYLDNETFETPPDSSKSTSPIVAKPFSFSMSDFEGVYDFSKSSEDWKPRKRGRPLKRRILEGKLDGGGEASGVIKRVKPLVRAEEQAEDPDEVDKSIGILQKRKEVAQGSKLSEPLTPPEEVSMELSDEQVPNDDELVLKKERPKKELHQRPPIGTRDLICEVIRDSPSGSCTFVDICEAIKKKYPFYMTTEINWMTNVRFVLSKCKLFKRCEDLSRVGNWTVDAEAKAQFVDPRCRRLGNKQQKPKAKKLGNTSVDSQTSHNSTVDSSGYQGDVSMLERGMSKMEMPSPTLPFMQQMPMMPPNAFVGYPQMPPMPGMPALQPMMPIPPNGAQQPLGVNMMPPVAYTMMPMYHALMDRTIFVPMAFLPPFPQPIMPQKPDADDSIKKDPGIHPTLSAVLDSPLKINPVTVYRQPVEMRLPPMIDDDELMHSMTCSFIKPLSPIQEESMDLSFNDTMIEEEVSYTQL